MDVLYLARNAAIAERQRALVRRRGRSWNGYPLWSAREIEILRRLYPDFKALKKALPGRTKYAVKLRARKVGVARPNHKWTTTEISRLRKLCTQGADRSEIDNAFPTIAWPVIQAQIGAHRFQKPKRKLKPSGNAVVDAIRERAVSEGISMVELDEMAGSGSKGYFRHCFSYRYPNGRCLMKAVEELGGRLVVEWND